MLIAIYNTAGTEIVNMVSLDDYLNMPYLSAPIVDFVPAYLFSLI